MWIEGRSCGREEGRGLYTEKYREEFLSAGRSVCWPRLRHSPFLSGHLPSSQAPSSPFSSLAQVDLRWTQGGRPISTTRTFLTPTPTAELDVGAQ